MKLYFRDRNPNIAKAWDVYWKDDPDVEISVGDIFSGPITDAIVSPANSFGFMDGGIDGIYSMRWPYIQSDLQEHLATVYHGELPVGNAVTIPIRQGGKQNILPISENPWAVKEGEPDFKWLISAPTMRIPMDIRGTTNVYLAMRAILIAVLHHNMTYQQEIESILCPGLGTAVGRMEPKMAAFQMHTAYTHIMKEPFEIGADLWNACDLHERMSAR